MKKVFVVYKTDAQHSYASRDVIAITDNYTHVEFLCQEQAKKEGDSIDKEQLWNLQNLKQTQGYSGEGEFQYEEVTLNVLL